jgi:cytochrome o ubiquinol oxidase operon protein cyoD
MSDQGKYDAGSNVGEDRSAGEAEPGVTLGQEVRANLLGQALAIGLTAASFWIATMPHLIYGPGVAMALLVLAVAQMGIHLVFFLHITTSPDNANNVLALAFGVLIVALIVFGSIWVMTHMNHNIGSMSEWMRKQQ